jgi:hypothetical protein
MSLSVPALSPQTTVGYLLTLLVAVLGIVVLSPPIPAHAAESKVFGDVVVGPEETEPEVYTGFGDVRVEGTVEEDIRSGFGDVVVRGPVGGEVEAGFGNVYVHDTVEGDVDVGRGSVELGPGGAVHGSVYYGSGEVRGNKDAVEGAMVAGRAPHMEHDLDGFGIPSLAGWIFGTAAFVACSVLAAVLAPGPVMAATRRAEASPGWSLLLGVGSVPAFFAFAVVLAVSIVGIPLLLLLAPAYLAFLFFGALVAAYFVGRRVVFATGRYRGGNALAAVVGALILAVAYLIPVLGGLLIYGLALLGAGASILALFSRRRTYPSYEAYVEDSRGL